MTTLAYRMKLLPLLALASSACGSGEPKNLKDTACEVGDADVCQTGPAPVAAGVQPTAAVAPPSSEISRQNGELIGHTAQALTGPQATHYTFTSATWNNAPTVDLGPANANLCAIESFQGTLTTQNSYLTIYVGSNGDWQAQAVAYGSDSYTASVDCIPYSRYGSGWWDYAYTKTISGWDDGLQPWGLSGDTSIGNSGISFLAVLQGDYGGTQNSYVGAPQGLGGPTGVVCGSSSTSPPNPYTGGCQPMALPSPTPPDIFLNSANADVQIGIGAISLEVNPGNQHCGAWAGGCYTIPQTSCRAGGLAKYYGPGNPTASTTSCTPAGVDSSGRWFCGATQITGQRGQYSLDTSGAYFAIAGNAQTTWTPNLVVAGNSNIDELPVIQMTCANFTN